MFLNQIDTSALWPLIAWAGVAFGVVAVIYGAALLYFRNRAAEDPSRDETYLTLKGVARRVGGTVKVADLPTPNAYFGFGPAPLWYVSTIDEWAVRSRKPWPRRPVRS